MMTQQNQLSSHEHEDRLSSLSVISQQDTPSAQPHHIIMGIQDDPYYQDGNRNNAKIVALVDFILAVIIIIALIAFIIISLIPVEENVDSDLDDNAPSKGDQLISISFKASFLVLLSGEIWLAILLLKSTKPATPHHKAVQLTKYWIFYNIFVVILTTVSIILLLLYTFFSMGWGVIGFLVLRLIFIGVVFRFWRELRSGGGAVTTTEASRREFTSKGDSSLNQGHIINFEE